MLCFDSTPIFRRSLFSRPSALYSSFGCVTFDPLFVFLLFLHSSFPFAPSFLFSPPLSTLSTRPLFSFLLFRSLYKWLVFPLSLSSSSSLSSSLLSLLFPPFPRSFSCASSPLRPLLSALSSASAIMWLHPLASSPLFSPSPTLPFCFLSLLHLSFTFLILNSPFFILLWLFALSFASHLHLFLLFLLLLSSSSSLNARFPLPSFHVLLFLCLFLLLIFPFLLLAFIQSFSPSSFFSFLVFRRILLCSPPLLPHSLLSKLPAPALSTLSAFVSSFCPPSHSTPLLLSYAASSTHTLSFISHCLRLSSPLSPASFGLLVSSPTLTLLPSASFIFCLSSAASSFIFLAFFCCFPPPFGFTFCVASVCSLSFIPLFPVFLHLFL